METPRLVDAPFPAGEAFAAYHVVYSSTRSHSGDWPLPTNADLHQGFEVGVLLSGQQRRTFQEAAVTADAGDAWLIPPWEPHGWETTLPNTHELVVHFVPAFLGDEQFAGISWLALFSVPPEKRPRTTDDAMRQRVLAIAAELAYDLERKPVGWLDAMRLNLLRLLLTLRQGWQYTDRAASLRRVRLRELARVMPAVRLVQSDPTRRVTLAEAARECGVSTDLFRAIFRHVMGLSFGKFAVRARLAKAAQLLRDTDMTIESIAADTGFSDASHLHRMFGGVYGRAPGRYRDEAQVSPEGQARSKIEARVIIDGR